jgi:hypothetical protein
MNQTISEKLFITLCGEMGIKCTSIPVSRNKTPDFEIELEGRKVIVEVKQIDPNPDEKKQLDQFKKDGRAQGSAVIGGRMRKTIRSARKQLQARAKGVHPALLVVYCTFESLAPHTDSNNVKAAMYGFEAVTLTPTDDPDSPIASHPAGFGGGRTLTEEHNTTISAVGVFEKDFWKRTHLLVYHNDFAAIPLPIVRGELIHHFRIQQPSPGQFQDWVQV